MISTDSSATEDYKEEDEKEDENNSDYFLHDHSVHETFPRHAPWCFDRIQPFESEPEPLINNPSVNRILKRSSPVVLSREYRRKSSTKRSFGSEDLGLEIFKRALIDQTSEKTRKSNWSLPIITTPCLLKDEAGEILVDGSSLMLIEEEEEKNRNSSKHSNDSILTNNTPGGSNASVTTATPGSSFLQDYDEYEQQQPSPWSQSPAPSPAVMDPEINPFFQSPPDIDDEAFNPVSPETYDSNSAPFPPPISNVHSIVHVPLFNPSSSVEHTSPTQKSQQQQQQQQQNQHQHQQQHHHHLFSSHTNSPLTNQSSSNNNKPQQQQSTQNYPIPIAILSFLAPIVPYPPVLLSSIASLSPFIAASFINALENAQIKKQGQFYNSRRKPNNQNNNNNENSRPKNFKRRSSKLKKKPDSEQEDEEEEKVMDSGNEEDEQPSANEEEEEENYLNQLHDSTNTTPKAVSEKRPDHLGSMSNFTRSSLETVTESLVHPQQQRYSNTDLSSLSSFDSSFSSAPADLVHAATVNRTDDITLRSKNVRKRSSQTSSVSSTSSKEQRRLSQSRASYQSLSPSYVAVMEGWGAVSPTTSLPISASIPPHVMCSDRKCVKHVNAGTDTEDECETNEDTNEPIEPVPPSCLLKRLALRSKRKTVRKSRYKRSSSGGSTKFPTKKVYDDDGFHYHRQPKQHSQHRPGVDRFLVAPKSSLLRLIIDGIPIHVL